MKKIFFIGAVFAPAITSAAITDLFSAFDYVQSILQYLLDLAMPLATAFFFWNAIKFIKAGGEGDAKKIEQGKQSLIWSGVALFLMVGIWSVVAYVQGSVGLDTGGQPLQNGPVFPKEGDIK